MFELFRMAAVYLKREILTLRFIGCTLFCSVLMIFFVFMDYKNDYSSEIGLYYFLRGVEYSGANSLLIIVTILPVVTIFCEDWESGTIKFTLTRSGKTPYAFAVTLTSAVSSGLCMFLSYVLFSLFILTKHALVPNVDTEVLSSEIFGFPNHQLLTNGNALLCYLLYFLTRSSMAAFYAALAVLQSVAVTNKRFAIISPVIMELLLSLVFGFIDLPSFLDPLVLFENHIRLYRDFGGDVENMTFSMFTAIYPTIYCAILLVIIALTVTSLLKNKVSKKI